MRATILLCAILLFAVSLTARQAPSQTTNPSFDVASIKPDDPSSVIQINRVLRRPGALEAHADLRYLIAYAYGLEPYEHVKGESRVLDERFAVIARAEAGVDASHDYPRMVGRLLADRFRLKAHIESEPQRVSVIRRVSAETLGPNLRPAPDCPSSSSASAEPAPARPMSCLAIGLVNGRMAVRVTMALFARALALLASSPMLDETGLTGTYDIDVAFNPATLMQSAMPSDDLPPFEDAMRKSLGLRVDSERRPVRVLVVDDVSAPTPD
jgi:uncharacterized protein (TIGR03435 family)